MHINIEGLQALLKVAELGNFREAADALFISQSALSRRISKLEQHLSVRLLNRTTRRVQLTAIGRNFIPQARRLVEELETSLNSLRTIGKHGAGQVVVACIPSAAIGLLPSIVSRYSALYPHNRIRILDVHVNDVAQAVAAGEAHFGISVANADRYELEAEPLMVDPFIVVCHRECTLATKKKVKWAELSSQHVIAAGRLDGNRALLDFGLPARVLRQHWLYEVQQSFFTGFALAAQGVGVVVAPRLAMPSENRLLVSRPLVDPVVSRRIVLIRRHKLRLSPAAQEFLALLRKHAAH